MSLVALYDKQVEKHLFVQNIVTVAILRPLPPPPPTRPSHSRLNKPIHIYLKSISNNATHSSE